MMEAADMLRSFLILLASASLISAEFLLPASDSVLRVGDIQEVQYKTTFTSYTIALWQQSAKGGGATLGPIIFQTTNGPQSKFDWLVQTYELPLEASNVFYLWLFEGGPSAQGNQSTTHRFWSGYFNITDEKATTTTAPTTTHSSELEQTQISTSPTPTSSTGGSSDREGDPAPASGLSTGARVGIGVGVGVVGIAAIASVVFFFRYRNKKKKEIEAWRARDSHTSEEWKAVYGGKATPMPPSTTPQMYPVELAAPSRGVIAELG